MSNIRQYGKYLQPFSNDPTLFDFREIYVLKTSFDDRYQHILEELETVAEKSPERWLTCRELLGRLKGKGISGFQEIDAEGFLLDFLHVMQGWGIQRKDKEDAIRLDSHVGSVILSLLRSDLVQALFKRRAMADEQIACLTSDLQLTELWSR